MEFGFNGIIINSKLAMLEFYFSISVLELHNTHTSIYVYTVFKLHVLCRSAYVKINPNSKPIVHPHAGIR